jgi:hypothetical protein
MLAGTGYDEGSKFHLILYRTNKPRGKKTNVYVIYKDQEGKPRERLGLIKWCGAMRQYWFEPDNNTGWTSGCLHLVDGFLKDKNDRHRKKLKRLKNGKNKNNELG